MNAKIKKETVIDLSSIIICFNEHRYLTTFKFPYFAAIWRALIIIIKKLYHKILKNKQVLN